jgi:hypothetical protein
LLAHYVDKAAGHTPVVVGNRVDPQELEQRRALNPGGATQTSYSDFAAYEHQR